MLQKLRSREPIDLPETYRHSGLPLTILGGIALLTVLVPLLLALAAGLLTGPRALALAIGIGTLVIVLFIGGIVGKPGHSR